MTLPASSLLDAPQHVTTEPPVALPRKLVGSLDVSKVKNGVPRGKYGAWQRRVRASVFGEPAFQVELVAREICAEQPHIWASAAWSTMGEHAVRDGIEQCHLRIHSAYRSVAFQQQIFEYRLSERRERRKALGLVELPDKELRRIQQKWTARPGRSAHHTGFALDLGLYHLGVRAGRRTSAWHWLMQNARVHGFYPYLEEPWHWEFNPPGLIPCVAALRTALQRGEPYSHMLAITLNAIGECTVAGRG